LDMEKGRLSLEMRCGGTFIFPSPCFHAFFVLFRWQPPICRFIFADVFLGRKNRPSLSHLIDQFGAVVGIADSRRKWRSWLTFWGSFFDLIGIQGICLLL
jgi:hypothetical protein